MYKGAFLDFDNVLFPTSNYERRVVEGSISNMLLKGLPAEFNDAVGKLMDIRKQDPNASDHFDQLCRFYGVDRNEQELIEAGVTTYHGIRDRLVVPEEGTNDFLDFLVENEFKSCVVTQGRRDKQLEKIERLKILDYFSLEKKDGKFVYVLEQTEDKENGKRFLVSTAISDLEIDPQHSFVLDDRPYGIVAAKKAGIRYGFRMMQGKYVTEDYEDIDERLKEDRKVKDFNDVVNALMELGLGRSLLVHS